ncbi:MAG: RNA polymerase factor sigma-54 [Candidatus Omnitrophica bacterium]|nr:RNA polymerase factor sigma-54 [Candidatus Omnitrophota bacterium]
MEIKQSQKLTQTLALTPQMRQFLRILQLPVTDLRHFLEAQAEENPILECIDPPERDLLKQTEQLTRPEQENPYIALGLSPEEAAKRRNYTESLITSSRTLPEHLLSQIRIQPLSSRQQLILEFLVGNLDENGYLNLSSEEISLFLRNEHHTPFSPEEIETAIETLKTCDPPGVGARNLKESLLLQLERRGKKDSPAYRIITSCLPELAKNKIAAISRKLKIPHREVLAAKKEISSLAPRPGDKFTAFTRQFNAASQPDLTVEQHKSSLEIRVNNSFLPRLRVSSRYLELLREGELSPETKRYIRGKVKYALTVIKAVMKREETIRRIGTLIVEHQKEFFLQGDPARLNPLTLKDIALKAHRNESTVSRVVNNKYISTPYGIYRLDFFLTKSFPSSNGADISQEMVKEEILSLIEEETADEPLKDSQIAQQLSGKGIRIARRTVAKYREELRIPPYHRRKRIRG